MPEGCKSPEERQGWKEVPCTHAEVNNTAGDPAKKWSELKVFDAWCDILEQWPAGQGG
jgi:hypothetical protein